MRCEGLLWYFRPSFSTSPTRHGALIEGELYYDDDDNIVDGKKRRHGKSIIRKRKSVKKQEKVKDYVDEEKLAEDVNLSP